MPDPVSYAEKSKWFKELCDAQEEIAAKRTASMVGNTYRVLVEPNEKEGWLTGRTGGNISIDFEGDPSLIGQFADVQVTQAKTWILYGKI
jgi:tRNA-2-methylthio-N6-dimethylallyladenosine synthase